MEKEIISKSTAGIAILTATETGNIIIIIISIISAIISVIYTLIQVYQLFKQGDIKTAQAKLEAELAQLNKIKENIESEQRN